MRLAERPRRALFTTALALFAVGFLAFAADDVAWMSLTTQYLESAKEARPDAGWRTAGTPASISPPLLDVAPIAALILVALLSATRNVPDEHARRARIALGFVLAGFALSILRWRFDNTHQHEGLWGTLQVGFAVAGLVTLAWAYLPARILALVGGAFLTARQPLIWTASDKFVEATGTASAAYGAELTKLAAHATGAAGSLILAVAFLTAAWSFARARGGPRSLPASGPLLVRDA